MAMVIKTEMAMVTKAAMVMAMVTKEAMEAMVVAKVAKEAIEIEVMAKMTEGVVGVQQGLQGAENGSKAIRVGVGAVDTRDSRAERSE